mmetsp:Transcript_13033/g.38845  ORF Transcript_13033/g.38845 Transcript_13033/m.38845 type:complete len:205 (-) Transcript_13033:472-1086(-)
MTLKSPAQGLPAPMACTLTTLWRVLFPWQSAEQAVHGVHSSNWQSVSPAQPVASHPANSSAGPTAGSPHQVSFTAISRWRLRVPGPQVAEHSPQSAQSPHLPSTQHSGWLWHRATGITCSLGRGSQSTPPSLGRTAISRVRRLWPMPHTSGAGTHSLHSFQLPHWQSTALPQVLTSQCAASSKISLQCEMPATAALASFRARDL